MANKPRSYSRETELQSKQDIRDRAKRNKARRLMLERLTAKYGRTKALAMMKGKDVNHRKSLDNKGSNTISNLNLESQKENRSRKEKDFSAGRPKKGKEPKARHKVKSRK